MSPPFGRPGTHTVANQPGPPPDGDPWADDPTLAHHVRAQGGDADHLARFGAALAAGGAAELGREARRDAPRLVGFDRAGRRLDEVRFAPAYHRLMALGLGHGYAALPWSGAKGGHVTHAAMVHMMTGVEPGTCCPMTMTYAAWPALGAAPDLAAIWRPKIDAGAYDPAIAPVAAKRGVTIGMAMTEKQGGSDLRATTTQAEPDGDGWRLTGHKWFCSAPMSDAFLTLAQTPDGLSCFLLPRWLEDGSRNAIHLVRLKDKLGNRANASAEIEMPGVHARPLGPPGDGIRTILTMVHHTRLDTAMAPAGLMRAALVEARHWCAGRRSFGRRLIEQPLMRVVLADLALDREAALALGLRVAAAFDAGDVAFARIGVALAKFLANKRCPVVVAEAMECLGGMGYVEDTPLPMLYREAPLNGIWEGSGNVICLDILRTLARDAAAREALDSALDAARGACRPYDRARAAHAGRWRSPPAGAEARLFAEQTALLLSAATLIAHAPASVADAYAASRLGERGAIPGAVAGLDTEALLARI